MSTTFSEGDLVEAVKGERRIRDRVVTLTDDLLFTRGPYLGSPSLFVLSTLASYAHAGYVLTLIEKATPPLPTEPGWYSDKDEDIWRLDATDRWAHKGYPYSPEQVAAYAPLTHLEPVDVTAKRVLNRVLDIWAFGPPAHVNNEIATIAKDFGVSS